MLISNFSPESQEVQLRHLTISFNINSHKEKQRLKQNVIVSLACTGVKKHLQLLNTFGRLKSERGINVMSTSHVDKG